MIEKEMRRLLAEYELPDNPAARRTIEIVCGLARRLKYPDQPKNTGIYEMYDLAKSIYRAVTAEKLENYETGLRVSVNAKTVAVTLLYPTVAGHVDEVAVDLEAVRAAVGIVVRYDMERDGWAILQPSRVRWPAGDEVCDEELVEVAFVGAWQAPLAAAERRVLEAVRDGHPAKISAAREELRDLES